MTQLEIATLARKSFVVKAVLVTADNMDAVAEWCGGEVCTVEGVTVVKFIDSRRAQRPKRISARIGEWITAEQNTDLDRGAAWLKSTSFKVYKEERLLTIFDVVQEKVVDPDVKKALVELFMESTAAQHLATTSGDQYSADDIHGSVINRILELFEPKVGLTFDQKRDRARTTARRVISTENDGNKMATARKIADAVLGELYA